MLQLHVVHLNISQTPQDDVMILALNSFVNELRGTMSKNIILCLHPDTISSALNFFLQIELINCH